METYTRKFGQTRLYEGPGRPSVRRSAKGGGEWMHSFWSDKDSIIEACRYVRSTAREQRVLLAWWRKNRHSAI